MSGEVFDNTVCQLGEGPLWHPERKALFWFDILEKKLFCKNETVARSWSFAEYVSAAGWINNDTLLVASETALLKFDVISGKSEKICGLEINNPATRSNDGRADPWGGFWIGTMGKNAETDAGAIYRYYRGELRQLYAPITIPNAICFSPDRKIGYFADTVKSKIWRQELDQINGWPQGDPEVFLDFGGTGINPDGAVCDSAGYFWNAQWGSSRLARYTPDGRFDKEIRFPAEQISCPAFGGPDLCTIYATSAAVRLDNDRRIAQVHDGKTFCVSTNVSGQMEHRVIL